MFVLSGVSAVAVATGYYHTCAIVTGSSLLCWGGNGNGQLGIGSTTDQHSPQAVSLGSGVPRVRVFIFLLLYLYDAVPI